MRNEASVASGVPLPAFGGTPPYRGGESWIPPGARSKLR
jgi:hypothetical protein